MTKTLYHRKHFRVITQGDDYEGPTIWIRDELDEAHLSFTRDELRDILPVLQGWVFGFNSGATVSAELLEALEGITDQLERVGDSRKDAPFIEAARAAIAKARADRLD